MKTQRFAIVLTVINLLLLMSAFFRANSAATPEVMPVLRCRELYIMDDKGRVRAELDRIKRDAALRVAMGAAADSGVCWPPSGTDPRAP